MFRKTKQTLKRLFNLPEPIQTTGVSQSHVLAFRMDHAGVSHDEQVLADLRNVRVVEGKLEEDQTAHSTSLFFCPMEKVLVKRRIKEGDGLGIDPYTKVNLVGIKAPNPILKKVSGLYNLENVLICANGVITIEATPSTKWVKV